MFDLLPAAIPDSLTLLGQLFNRDPRPDKIDLGVGTYRDEAGAVPIMKVVKIAERQLLEAQSSKGYFGPLGDSAFASMLFDVLFPRLAAERKGQFGLVQTPGGTGALRLALEVVAMASPGAQVWVATPTWPAHEPLIRAAGLGVRTYRHLSEAKQFDDQGLAVALSEATSGDVVLLHGCCHNPTGIDLPTKQWRRIAMEVQSKGLVPLIDLAYAGLGEGIEADVAGVRSILESCDQALVAVSCSKSFGLYRDRTGLLIGAGPSSAATERFMGAASVRARLLWSNPPDHGAAVVRTILESPGLTSAWCAELGAMRVRIKSIREQLAALSSDKLDLSGLCEQRGMFALLPLDGDDVVRLREADGIFVDFSGRVNVAGLNSGNFRSFAAALARLKAGASDRCARGTA